MSVSDAAVLAAMDTLARHALFLKPEEMRLALEAAEPFLVERERETRENANACTLRVETERDALRSAHDSLMGELATILGTGKALDTARADVDTLLEVIATFGAALEDEGGASTLALYAAADTIAARRMDAS